MTNRITVTAQLREGFEEKVQETILEEFDIAQQKWGISLSPEQKRLVYVLTMMQLSERMENVYKHRSLIADEEMNDLLQAVEDNQEIKLGLERIRVVVRSNRHSKDTALYTGEGYVSGEDILLHKSSSGFIVHQEEHAPKTVWLSEFSEHIEKKFLQWAATGVFYGVASFKE